MAGKQEPCQLSLSFAAVPLGSCEAEGIAAPVPLGPVSRPELPLFSDRRFREGDVTWQESSELPLL